MRSQLVIEVNPLFCCPQKLSERAIRSAFSDRELKLAHKAFGIAVIRRCSCPAHRPLKAFAQERVARLLSAILTALIAMPNHARHREGNHLNRGDDQVSTHTIIKRQCQDVPCAFSQGKAPTHFGLISQMHFKDIQKRRSLSPLESSRLVAYWGQRCSPCRDRHSVSSCDELQGHISSSPA